MPFWPKDKEKTLFKSRNEKMKIGDFKRFWEFFL